MFFSFNCVAAKYPLHFCSITWFLVIKIIPRQCVSKAEVIVSFPLEHCVSFLIYFCLTCPLPVTWMWCNCVWKELWGDVIVCVWLTESREQLVAKGGSKPPRFKKVTGTSRCYGNELKCHCIWTCDYQTDVNHLKPVCYIFNFFLKTNRFKWKSDLFSCAFDLSFWHLPCR